MPGSSRLPISLPGNFGRRDAGKSPALLVLKLDLLRNVVFFLFVLRWARKSFYHLRGRGVLGTLALLYRDVNRILYGLFLRMPGIRGHAQHQVEHALAKIRTKLVPTGATRHLALPKKGMSPDAVVGELRALAGMEHARWEDGLVPGAVYNSDGALLRLQTEAFSTFTVANPMLPDVFPGVRKMDAEIVAMVLALFHAPPAAAGTTTSGGTESILLACLSARQKAFAERGVTEPEMILPETAHAAFIKAGSYLNIKCRLVACPAPKYQVDTRAVARLVNPNTILLVGSAPSFPHGIIDDITTLSHLAARCRIPLHVDCCLGSFLVPFLERAGFDSQPFDFRLRGVTSISCDTHKYGFAPQGNSTILYRSSDLRAYQYFVSPEWTGGVYGSPGLPGSRSGALVAACWASMMSVGEDGYMDACVRIVGTAKKIADAVRDTPALAAELDVVGRPLVSVVAFTARNLSIYNIIAAMTARGWHLNALQNPPAMHIAVTLPTVGVWERLVADLEAAVESEREKERVRLVEGKGGATNAAAESSRNTAGDLTSLYGMAGSLPDKSVVVDLVKGFLDILYRA